MTQEEKAKAYDEALERMKSWVRGEHPECFTEAQKAAEFIFPELKESEDERIRQELIQYIKNWKANIQGKAYTYLWSSDKEECNKLLAWLEKQGNNLVKNGYTDNKDIIKYADNYSHEIWRKLMDNFENIKDYHIGCNDVSDIVLNAIIDAYNWLEKQGEKKSIWSEKDDGYKLVALSAFLNYYDEENPLRKCLINWLKSLKQRMGG